MSDSEPVEYVHRGPKAAQLQEFVGSLDPQLAQWGADVVSRGVWARPGLSYEERMLVAISCLAATEHEGHLRNYLHSALHGGVKASKIHEALLMQVVYGGWPVVTSALSVWQGVVTSARGRGMDIDTEYPK